MNVLDTYALLEIKKGNPHFADLMKTSFMITDPTIAEFYVVIMKDQGEEEARFWFRQLSGYCKQVSKEIMIKALKFREENMKEGLSFFDVASYLFARESGYMFVTGNKQFKHRDGVLFLQ